MKYKLTLSYVGTHFFGWQIQPSQPSIQANIEHALGVILRTSVNLVGCGRTDTGVHAKNYVAHFEIENEIIDFGLFLHKINGLIHRDIAIHDIEAVNDDFHARFDAVSRAYTYHLHTRKNPFLNLSSFLFKPQLDIEKMNEAAKLLLTHKDFQCFSKSKTQVHTYLCDVYEAKWTKLNDEQLVFYIKANRFLRNMVRAVVGTLLEVGTGEKSIADFQAVLESKNRSLAGKSVPAHALCLTEITYPHYAK